MLLNTRFKRTVVGGIVAGTVEFDYALNGGADTSVGNRTATSFTMGTINGQTNNGQSEYNYCVKSKIIGPGVYRVRYANPATGGGVLIGVSSVNGGTYDVVQYYTWGSVDRYTTGYVTTGRVHPVTNGGVESYVDIIVEDRGANYEVRFGGKDWGVESAPYVMSKAGDFRLCIGNTWHGGATIYGVDVLTYQYVSAVYDFSSQFADARWIANNVIGIPTLWQYGDQAGSWTVLGQAANQIDWIDVNFGSVVNASGCTVFKNNGWGFIKQIDAWVNGAWVSVWAGADSRDLVSAYNRSLYKWAPVQTNRLKVTVQRNTNTTWHEIDAISLLGVA